MVTRRWDKTSDNTFSFFVNDEEVGKIQKTFKTSGITAHFSIRKDNFTIKRTGFWKSVVEVFDAKGQIIAKVQTTNWFSSSFILEYNDKKYSLMARNNPLAEWVILKDGKELLSYGIGADQGRIAVKITSPQNNADYFFDFLLWYLFNPIAAENSGDSFIFLNLLLSQ